jgi:DNA-binding transcriptional MerR regulator/methylmalonyl-CoA mutase cobalamin-binding subunit
MKPPTLSIAAVERDTGLSKDTLRVWERRYGFPLPQRDALGERAYPLDQVEKLRIVRRLLDGGHRPGRVVGMPLDELRQLSESSPEPVLRSGTAAVEPIPPALYSYLDLVRAHDLPALRRQLTLAQLSLGLGRFVLEVVVPLNTLIGDAWMRGQLEIFEEHACSEAMQAVMRQALHRIPEAPADASPTVLLTTFPGEPHGLGLLMAEALLALDGARCVSLGLQTPLWDTVLAAQAFRADIVALAFSGAANPQQVADSLAELRAKLPAATEVWVGGSAPVLHRRTPPGVTALASLGELHGQLRRWRSR